MAQQEQPAVSLETLGNGAAVEMFDREFLRVLENICDVNTSATAKREITLKVTVTPNEDREVGAVSLSVNSKLSGVKGVGTMLYIGMRNGKPVAMEQNPRQPAFDIFERDGGSQKPN